MSAWDKDAWVAEAASGVPSPAPWSLGPWGHNGSGIDDANGVRIAGLRYAGGSVSMKVQFETWAANWRLMIAAPELLAALDNLVGAGAVHEFDCDHAEHDADGSCIYCEARAAILRATTGGNGEVS